MNLVQNYYVFNQNNDNIFRFIRSYRYMECNFNFYIRLDYNFPQYTWTTFIVIKFMDILLYCRSNNFSSKTLKIEFNDILISEIRRRT